MSDPVTVTKLGDSVILRVNEDITISNTEELTRHIEAQITNAHRNLFVDMSNVGFIDSHGMRFLLSANRYALQNDITMYLCDMSLNIRKSLERVFLGQEFKYLNRVPSQSGAQQPAQSAGISVATPASDQVSEVTTYPSVTFTIKSYYVNLRCVRVAISEICRSVDISSVNRETIDKLVFEVCDNVIRHAYGGECALEFSIEFTVYEESATITIIDGGPEFDLSSKLNSLHAAGISAISGDPVGLRFIASAVEAYSYERKDGRNCFTMVRRLKKN